MTLKEKLYRGWRKFVDDERGNGDGYRDHKDASEYSGDWTWGNTLASLIVIGLIIVGGCMVCGSKYGAREEHSQQKSYKQRKSQLEETIKKVEIESENKYRTDNLYVTRENFQLYTLQ